MLMSNNVYGYIGIGVLKINGNLVFIFQVPL